MPAADKNATPKNAKQPSNPAIQRLFFMPPPRSPTRAILKNREYISTRQQEFQAGREFFRSAARELPLLAEMFFKECGHQLVGFLGFGKRGIVPESVWQRFENYQVCVDSIAKVGTVQDGGAAQQEIAATGDKQRSRKPSVIGVKRRKNWIGKCRRSDVLRTGATVRIGIVQVSGETVQRKQHDGISRVSKVSQSRENSGCRWKRQIQLFQFHRDLRSEDRASRGAVNPDVIRLIGLEQLFVDCDCIVEARGERMFGCQAIEHRDDLDAA